MKINAPEVKWNELTAQEERYLKTRANNAIVREFRNRKPQQSWLRQKWELFLDLNFR